MHSNILKSEAIKLRLRGKTYSDINTKLNTNFTNSTLSSWLNNLVLTDFYKKRLKENIDRKLSKARIKAHETNRKKRLEYLEALKNKNLQLLNSLNLPVQKILLSVLYLAEGSKHKNTPFLSLGSSDPAIIKFYLSLLKKCFKIDNSKFRIRIQCRADQNIKSLENFWQKITGVTFERFYPTYIDKRTIGKKTLKKNYKGVCAVYYFDTSIQLELELLAISVIKYTLKGR